MRGDKNMAHTHFESYFKSFYYTEIDSTLLYKQFSTSRNAHEFYIFF